MLHVDTHEAPAESVASPDSKTDDLAGSREWGGVRVEVEAVRFGVQRAEFAFAAPSLGRDPFILALENVNGVIDATTPTGKRSTRSCESSFQ